MREYFTYSVGSDGVAVVQIAGTIDSYTTPALKELLNELINSGHINLVLDMTGTEFFSSPGLGAVIGALKRVRAHRGTLALVITTAVVMKHFRVTGLNKVFNIFDTLPGALECVTAVSPSFESPRASFDEIDNETGWHWFPARIYSSDSDAGREVEKQFVSVLEVLGIEVAYEFPVEYGSWFRQYILRMKDSTALPTRDEALALLQRALEQRALDRPQAQIDLTESQAVANLIHSLSATPNAVVQIGSVLLIKVRETMVVRNLTQLELAHWERNPGLFRDPESAMQELQRAYCQDMADQQAKASDAI